MTGRIHTRLKELGISLPRITPPVANYVPFVRSGSLIHISGQLPTDLEKNIFPLGIVGDTLTVEDGRAAARSAAINVLAILNAAVDGDLDRVTRIVKLTGYVNAVPGFSQHPEIVNGASDLFVEIFGDVGRHARAAVGAGSLPRNAAVEIEALVEAA